MENFDVAVIGAGVVGVATARHLALTGARVVLIEKGADILSGASKANSAILHTGFDAPEGSLELTCMQAGYQDFLDLMGPMNLSLLRTGAMVVAWTADQAEALGPILSVAHRNGVTDVQALTPGEVASREPGLAPSLGAVFVPGEHVIDPWTPFHAYAQQILAAGSTILRGVEVTGGHFDGIWTLQTTDGPLTATTVINAAGLYGDRVEALLLGNTHFTIKPRKGQFVVFDKAAARLLSHIILPVPDARTKGVVLCRTAFGNLLIGPTAEETPDRDRPTVSTVELQALLNRARQILPALAEMPVTATYAGLRPASDEKHYRIRHDPARNWLTLGGIRSTGLTASLGLARHAAGILQAGALQEAAAPQMPNLSEHRPRDWNSPGHGGILCHCEMVTTREIRAALDGPFPPGDLGGLKRRTRCAMGRCQGFNCLGALEEITRGRLAPALGLTR